MALQVNSTFGMEGELLLVHLFLYLKSENIQLLSIWIMKNMLYADHLPKFNEIVFVSDENFQ